jgi:O-antigen/teichoic acid export membrane protein
MNAGWVVRAGDVIAGRIDLAGLANMALRAGTLGARFALSIYLVRVLGFAALGRFGLIAGLAGVLPSVLGFGMSYHVNRTLLHADRQEGYRLLRDRMAISVALLMLLWGIGAFAVTMGLELPPLALVAAAIISLEVIAFDTHVGLLNLGRPLIANLLLFVRSASWIVPLIAVGLVWPAGRSFDAVLTFWLAALVVNVALLPVLLMRDANLKRIMAQPIDWRTPWVQASRTPFIYLNDMAQAGQVYLDRFVVAHQLGIAAAGVYTLVFSVTHGVYLLSAAATTQSAPRRLAAALTARGASGFNSAMRIEAARALRTGGIVAAVVLVATLVILPRFGFSGFVGSATLFAWMLAAALIRPLADLAQNGLYLARADHALAGINLAGVALSIVGALALTAWLGLTGIGVAALGVTVAMLAARLAWLRARGQTLTGTPGPQSPDGSASRGS